MSALGGSKGGRKARQAAKKAAPKKPAAKTLADFNFNFGAFSEHQAKTKKVAKGALGQGGALDNRGGFAAMLPLLAALFGRRQ